MNKFFRQNDIGLENFERKQLFVELFIPTIVVIITVIQLHYCHDKFMTASKIPERQENSVEEVSENETNEDQTENEAKPTWIAKISANARIFYQKFLHFSEAMLLIVEIHANKVVLLYLFLLTTRSTALVHLTFTILAIIGLKVKTKVQLLVTRIASLIAAVILILTMVYQFNYIDSKKFESSCGNSSQIQVSNNAEWLGLSKIEDATSLIVLVRHYLVYIVLVSIHSFIALRQRIKRIKKNQPEETPDEVFKDISRKDADKGLPQLFKYLINYGFYKFGKEICSIFLAIVIAYRMDLVACIYSILMLVLTLSKRENAKRIWSYATYTIAASIFIQYVSLIGLPPGFCRSYPWQHVAFLKGFSIYAFLPENTEDFKSKSKLLLMDYILLFCMCCQIDVFKTEHKHEASGDAYPGGSNKSIVDEIDQLGIGPFVRQTHDFMEKAQSYLDICKQLVFNFFFWMALAVVFLTGTSHGNIFSIGYIIGSFVFLWQGTDFYMKPIKVIVKWWNHLIDYNVAVIFIKSLIQMIGCLVLNSIKTESYCWLLQVSFAFKKDIKDI